MVKKILMTEVSVIMRITGLSVDRISRSGMRLSVTRRTADSASAAKQSAFLHRKTATIYRIAVTIFALASARCKGESAG